MRMSWLTKAVASTYTGAVFGRYYINGKLVDKATYAAQAKQARHPSAHNPAITYGHADDRDSDDKHFRRGMWNAAKKVRQAKSKLAAAQQAGPKDTPEIAALRQKLAEHDAKAPPVAKPKRGKRGRKPKPQAAPVAAQPPASNEPPPPKAGHVRLYHGSKGQSPTNGGGRWVTPSLQYARDFRANSDAGNEVHYVDVPEDHPEIKDYLDDVEYSTGSRDPKHIRAFETSEELAKQMKPHAGGQAAATPAKPVAKPAPASKPTASPPQAKPTQPQARTSKPNAPAGKMPPPLPKRPQANDHIADIHADLGGLASDKSIGHEDLGSEFEGKMQHYPPAVQAEAKKRYGIKDSDSYTAMGEKVRAFHAKSKPQAQSRPRQTAVQRLSRNGPPPVPGRDPDGFVRPGTAYPPKLPARPPAKPGKMPLPLPTRATPPPLPHAQTQQRAISAANALHAGGGPGALKAATDAVEAHRTAGSAHIDRLARAKHGNTPRAQSVAEATKRTFHAKLDRILSGMNRHAQAKGVRLAWLCKGFGLDLSVVKAFEESDHPRDHGQFASKPTHEMTKEEFGLKDKPVHNSVADLLKTIRDAHGNPELSHKLDKRFLDLSKLPISAKAANELEKRGLIHSMKGTTTPEFGIGLNIAKPGQKYHYVTLSPKGIGELENHLNHERRSSSLTAAMNEGKEIPSNVLRQSDEHYKRALEEYEPSSEKPQWGDLAEAPDGTRGHVQQGNNTSWTEAGTKRVLLVAGNDSNRVSQYHPIGDLKKLRPKSAKGIRLTWVQKNFTESDHPRDHGQFASKPGGGGEGTESKPAGKATFTATPYVTPRGEIKPEDRPKMGPDFSVIEGAIGHLPITTRDRGLIEKVTKKTKAALEEAFADPAVVESMHHAGFKNIRIEPTKGPGKPAKWSAAHSSGTLMIHPRTAEYIAASSNPERIVRGFKGVIHHEAGHGMFDGATDAQRDAFAQALKDNPSILEHVGKIVNVKPPKDAWDYDEKARAISEAHAEVQAIRHYRPEKFAEFPEAIRKAADAILDHAKAKPRGAMDHLQVKHEWKSLRLPWLRKTFNESEHPRDHGQFASKPGGSPDTSERNPDTAKKGPDTKPAAKKKPAAKSKEHDAEKVSALTAAIGGKPEVTLIRLRELGRGQTCMRCSGSGEYSYNQRDGKTCYGCMGAGVTMPKVDDELIEAVKKDIEDGKLQPYLDRIKAVNEAKKAGAKLAEEYSKLTGEAEEKERVEAAGLGKRWTIGSQKGDLAQEAAFHYETAAREAINRMSSTKGEVQAMWAKAFKEFHDAMMDSQKAVPDDASTEVVDLHKLADDVAAKRQEIQDKIGNEAKSHIKEIKAKYSELYAKPKQKSLRLPWLRKTHDVVRPAPATGDDGRLNGRTRNDRH